MLLHLGPNVITFEVMFGRAPVLLIETEIRPTPTSTDSLSDKIGDALADLMRKFVS